MPDTLTLDALAALPNAADRYMVEVHSLDPGWYLVRLHEGDRVFTLVDKDGKTQRFTGTQWISRALRPLGFYHATLTWPAVADEMVGTSMAIMTPADMLACGTRVSFQTE